MFYLIIFFFFVFVVFINCIQKKVHERRYTILLILTLWFIAAFRYETGGDWIPYVEIFVQCEWTDISWNSWIEPGYALLNIISKAICNNIQFLYVILASISSVLLYKSIREYSCAPLLSVMIYYTLCFWGYDMALQRQGLSCLIFMYSLKYIEHRKFLQYSICVLMASTIHLTAICLLPLYFVLNKRWSNIILCIIIACSLTVFFLKISWMSILLGDMADFLSLNKLRIAVGVYSQDNTRRITLGVFLNLVFLLLFWRFRKYSIKPYYNLFFNLFIVNFIVYFAFSEFEIISLRFRLYFLFSFIYLLPFVFDLLKIYANKLICILLLVSYTFYNGFSFFMETSAALPYNPYQNYLLHIIFETESTGRKRLELATQDN